MCSGWNVHCVGDLDDSVTRKGANNIGEIRECDVSFRMLTTKLTLLSDHLGQPEMNHFLHDE
jgi:hypothetical protein